jgi:BMFP domain-containing protein YqiC
MNLTTRDAIAKDARPVSRSSMAKIVENMAKSVREYMQKKLARLDELEKRIAQLEAQQVKYAGIWRDDDDYGQGDIVTHDGVLWHCWKATRERPGTSLDWQMMLKHKTAPRS